MLTVMSAAHWYNDVSFQSIERTGIDDTLSDAAVHNRADSSSTDSKYEGISLR